MKLLSLRSMITTIAAAITLSVTMISATASMASAGQPKWLQVYSMRHVTDAQNKAWDLRQNGVQHATVFQAHNGFYAVVAGKIAHNEQHLVSEWKQWNKIPHDSFLTSGKQYYQEISMHGYQPKPAHKPKPKTYHAPKPKQPTYPAPAPKKKYGY